ncbi:MAG: flagellar biosynthetic protein FliO [Planctomycetota bacterium]|nr:flagellar biosynthetic protein FliO [Planctomycetota bacterium]MDA1177373.1 flagellar biosynthetic protein FliO [Planctomycetota bacterium]
MLQMNLPQLASHSLLPSAISCVLVVAMTSVCPADTADINRSLTSRTVADPQQVPLPSHRTEVVREPVTPSPGNTVIRPFDATRRSNGPNVRTTGGFLLVLGGLLLAVWLTRNNRNSPHTLPTPVAEFLGRIPFPNREPLHLLRLGSKLVLIASQGQQIQTVAEVTDPEEVLRLTELCRSRLSARPQRDGRHTEEILQRVSRGAVELGERVAC